MGTARKRLDLKVARTSYVVDTLGRLDAKGQAAWEKRKAASEILVVEGVHMRALPAVVNVVLSYSAAQVKYHHLQLLLEIQAPKVAYMMLGYLQQLVREPHDYTGGIGCAE